MHHSADSAARDPLMRSVFEHQWCSVTCRATTALIYGVLVVPKLIGYLDLPVADCGLVSLSHTRNKSFDSVFSMRRWFLSYHSPDGALAERVKAAIERKD